MAFTVASLFSGCGGFDLGFSGGFTFLGRTYEMNPFEIVVANDNDPDAVSVYVENLKHFNTSDMPLLADVQSIDARNVPDFDVLTAGFPCQPFSSAGKRKGVNDHRGTLFEEVIRFVRVKRPKAIVLENVRGLLSSRMPNGKPVVREIRDQLESVQSDGGRTTRYRVGSPRLLRASNFGVPQDRYRVLIIAFREDLNISPDLSLLEGFSKPFSREDLKVKAVLNYDSSLPNASDTWDLSPQSRSLVPHIKRSWKDVPYELLPQRMKRIRDNIKRYRSPNFYRRFDFEEINGTITASAQPENCGILHPIENRRYNVREIARFQSFPDDFTFHSVSIPSMYKVIGNAVPPVLAHAIAKYVLAALTEDSGSRRYSQYLFDYIAES
ncbi:DNA cytosine methyltransferase [Mesotoga sp. H07.pep.5.3]|uniref:DNA cytosine methyltransferase n=1 Tax=Mesotoga sp. H07.pep.5.3 TaxID=1421003 RepID=UPI000C191BC3|nr:DNA cytosine methyltransferase [Mesotoga sp. H07.pep.5.3]